MRHLADLPNLPLLTLYTDGPLEPVDAVAAEVLSCPRVRVRVVPRRRPWLRFWLPLAAWRDGISVMHFPGTILPPFRPFRSVVTVYDLAALHSPELALVGEVRRVNTVVRRSVVQSDRVLAISQTTARDVQRFFGVPPERVTVTPLAADARFRPIPNATAHVAERFSLQEPYLLFVGTPYPRKNLEGVLRAMALLGAVGEGVVLAVASRKEEVAPGIRQRAAELGIGHRVRFLGSVPDEDLPALYSAAQMLVHPAFHEGFCLPLLEAMACGTPVVTSNTSALPEVAGDAALLVDPSRPEAIAAAIRQLLTDRSLRESLVRRGKERVSQFSWRRTAALTLEAYRLAADLTER